MSPYQTDSKNLLVPETDIDARIAGLSPEKRTLLLKRLSRGSAAGGLWSSVLQVSSVGVNDDFFILGGDSLRGARLLTSVKAVFGVELPIELLFRNAATVAGMAGAIEATRSANATVDHG